MLGLFITVVKLWLIQKRMAFQAKGATETKVERQEEISNGCKV